MRTAITSLFGALIAAQAAVATANAARLGGRHCSPNSAATCPRYACTACAMSACSAVGSVDTRLIAPPSRPSTHPKRAFVPPMSATSQGWSRSGFCGRVTAHPYRLEMAATVAKLHARRNRLISADHTLTHAPASYLPPSVLRHLSIPGCYRL